MTFEQCTGPSKPVEYRISSNGRHRGRVYLLQDENIRRGASVIAKA
jgi:hypothetical protein